MISGEYISFNQCTHTYTNIYINIYICVCVFVCVQAHWHNVYRVRQWLSSIPDQVIPKTQNDN